MPVPSTIADLDTVAGNNYPTGGESPSSTDDYFRAHAAFIAQLSFALIPIGGICMYDGLIADLPANFKVCDGTSGTPDLRNRFIVGSGSTYALGATGGSANAVVVSHTHSITDTGHNHGVSDPGHAHSGIPDRRANADRGSSSSDFSLDDVGATSGATTGITINSATTGISVQSSGVSGTNANLPPYYALVYIKRVS